MGVGVGVGVEGCSGRQEDDDDDERKRCEKCIHRLNVRYSLVAVRLLILSWLAACLREGLQDYVWYDGFVFGVY